MPLLHELAFRFLRDEGTDAAVFVEGELNFVVLQGSLGGGDGVFAYDFGFGNDFPAVGGNVFDQDGAATRFHVGGKLRAVRVEDRKPFVIGFDFAGDKFGEGLLLV